MRNQIESLTGYSRSIVADFGLDDDVDGPTYFLEAPHYILYLVVGGVFIGGVLSPRVEDKQRINILFDYFSLVDVTGCEEFEIMLFIDDLLVFFLRKCFGFCKRGLPSFESRRTHKDINEPFPVETKLLFFDIINLSYSLLFDIYIEVFLELI